MKKSVIILVIILLGIAGWAGATYLIGGQVEQRYQDHIARFEQWGPFHLTSESYQRGFLSSRARTLLELSVPVPADEEGEVETRTLHLTLEHKLLHGPLPVGASVTPQLARIETRLVGATLGDGNELLAEMPWLNEVALLTSIGFDGGGRGRLLVPAFEKTVEEKQLTVSWGGLRSDTKFSANLAALAGNIELSGLQLTAKDGRLQWDGARADFDLHEAFPMVYLGRYRTESGPLELDFNETGEGRQQIRVEGFAVDSLASQNGETVDYLQKLKLAEITVGDAGYGPGELEVAVKGLDGEVLSRYQQDMLGVYGQEALDPEIIGLQMMQVYMRLLSGLAEGAPEIELRKVQFATPEGDFSGSLRLKLNGEAGLEPGDVVTLLQKLEGQAQLTADENLVRTVLSGMVAQQMRTFLRQQNLPLPTDKELAAQAGSQVEQQLAALIGQQYIERSGGKFRCQAVLGGGELTVNGQRLM